MKAPPATAAFALRRGTLFPIDAQMKATAGCANHAFAIRRCRSVALPAGIEAGGGAPQAAKAEPPPCTMSLRYFAGGLPSAFLNMVMNAVTDS